MTANRAPHRGPEGLRPEGAELRAAVPVFPGDDSVPVRGVAPGAGAGGRSHAASSTQIRERSHQFTGAHSRAAARSSSRSSGTREKIRAFGGARRHDNERGSRASGFGAPASRSGHPDAEQRTKYDLEMADARSARQAIFGRVFVLGPMPSALPVHGRLGSPTQLHRSALSDLKEARSSRGSRIALTLASATATLRL